MNIPDKIIEAVEMLPDATDRGQAFAAIISFMRTETEPDFEMTSTALGIFRLAMLYLGPILRRRKRDAARRAEKKSKMADKINEAADIKVDADIPKAAEVRYPATTVSYEGICVPLSRAERRRLERERRKRRA